MTELLFTTNDVANMLQVDKSTVKRWTDEGKLKCFRTPGGHRKFRAEDLYQFMADYNYTISSPDIFPKLASDEAILHDMITRKEFNVLDSVCFSASIKGNKDEVLKLFIEAYRNGMSLALILDKIMRPTVKKISDLHSGGKLQLAEKQLALNCLSNAIVLLSDTIAKSSRAGKIAVCAMAENDGDDLELKALVVLLESQGIEVFNLGVGTTADSITQLVRSKQPNFVFLIASSAPNGDSLADEHRKILADVRTYGARLIIGGGGYTEALRTKELNGLYDVFCSSFKEFTTVLYVRSEFKKKEKE